MRPETLGRACAENIYELRSRVRQLMRACNSYRVSRQEVDWDALETSAVAIAETALSTVGLWECCEGGIPLHFE